MGRHAKWNNVAGLVEILEVDRVVAFMAVKDEQLIYSSCMTLGRMIKIF